MERASERRKVFDKDFVTYRERWFNGYCATISFSFMDWKWGAWIIHQNGGIIINTSLPTTEAANEWFRTAEKHLFLHLAQAE